MMSNDTQTPADRPWSDEKIEAWLAEQRRLNNEVFKEPRYQPTWDEVKFIIHMVRDDVRQEAEAQRGEWEPVPEDTNIDCAVNGKYGVFMRVHLQPQVEVFDPSDPDEPEQIFVFLPDDIRLCRRKAKEQL